jgi:tetratricopeptide (TPR) repeat protein
MARRWLQNHRNLRQTERARNWTSGPGWTGASCISRILVSCPRAGAAIKRKMPRGGSPRAKEQSHFKSLGNFTDQRFRKYAGRVATYSTHGRDGKKWYTVRGFVATGDICGDLEFYSESPMTADDPDLSKIFESYRLDSAYVPEFNDIFLYAQVLYQHQMYKAAGPIFEQALAKLDDDKAQQTMRRVITDQAGMSYGMSGDVPKARAIFENASAKDPDYAMYYYNLACADAEEKDLANARLHLQQAFARKGYMIPGENLPDPTKDDSFIPYRKNKDFWTFLQGLH